MPVSPQNTDRGAELAVPRGEFVTNSTGLFCMDNKSSSTDRVRRLRARRSRGIVMSSLVEVGEGGIELLMRNRLLKHEEKENRQAVQKAVEGALEQWAGGRGSRIRNH